MIYTNYSSTPSLSTSFDRDSEKPSPTTPPGISINESTTPHDQPNRSASRIQNIARQRGISVSNPNNSSCPKEIVDFLKKHAKEGTLHTFTITENGYTQTLNDLLHQSCNNKQSSLYELE